MLRDSPKLQSFKKCLLASYRLPAHRSILGIHDSLGIRRLFQLRVGLSPLLGHKSNHKFLDTPSDKCITCNRTENLEHFFLYCTRLVAPRDLLFAFIKSLKTNFELLEPGDVIKPNFYITETAHEILLVINYYLKQPLNLYLILNGFHNSFSFLFFCTVNL